MVLFTFTMAVWKLLWQKLASTWTGMKSYLRVRTEQYQWILVPRYWLHAEKVLKSHKCVLKSSSLLGCPTAERTHACKSGRLGFNPNWLCDCANLVTSLCLSSNELNGNMVLGPAYVCSAERLLRRVLRLVDGRRGCSVICLILTEGTAVKYEQFSATYVETE